MDPTVVALIGTIMGGVGLKVVESWLGKNRVKIDDAAKIRDELRLEIGSLKSEITALRAENKQLENDVDKWRNEYFNMYADIVAVKTELQLTQGQLPRPPPE